MRRLADPRDAALLAAPFVFLRHGETENNRLGLVAGSTDVPLNDKGMAQAWAAAVRLAESGIDAIWSSPLARARATAACVGAALDLPVRIVPQLAERNWGSLEGTPRALRVPGVTPPGGESAEDFQDRALNGLSAILPSRLPLVVAHSGIFRMLSAWLGIEPRSTPIDNCVPLLFEPQADGWRVRPVEPN